MLVSCVMVTWCCAVVAVAMGKLIFVFGWWLFQVNRESPYYRSQFHSTEQSVEAVVSSVSLRVQRESLSNLVAIARDIYTVVT